MGSFALRIPGTAALVAAAVGVGWLGVTALYIATRPPSAQEEEEEEEEGEAAEREPFPCCVQCGVQATTPTGGGLSRCARCKAVRYCSTACQKAHWPQYRHHCRKKEEAAPAPGSPAAMEAAAAEMQQHLDKGRELQRRAEYLPALAEFWRMLEIAERVGHQQAVGVAHGDIGDIHRLVGDYPAAMEHYEESKKVMEALGDVARLGATLNNMAIVHEQRGEYPRALELYEEVKSIMEAVGDVAGLGRALGNMANVHQQLGQYPRALELFEEDRKICVQLGDVAGLGTTLNNIGEVHLQLGQHQRALEYYEESKTIAKRIGNPAGLSNTLRNMGVVCEELEDFDRALTLYEESKAIVEQIEDAHGLSKTLTHIGNVHLRKREPQRALEHYEKSKEIQERIGDVARLGNNLNNMAMAYEQLGQHQRALELHKKVKATCERLGDLEGVATSLLNIGACLYASDKSPAGLEAATKSLTGVFQLTSQHRRQLVKIGRSAVLSVMQGHFNRAIALQTFLVEAALHAEALAVAEASRAQTLHLHTTTDSSAPSEEGDGLGINWQQEVQRDNTVFIVYSLVPGYKNFEKHSNHLLCWTIGAGPDLAFTSTEASELAALVNLCRHSDLAMRNRAFAQSRGQNEDSSHRGQASYVTPPWHRLRRVIIPPALEELLAGRGFDDDDELNVVFVPTGCLALVPFAALRTPDGTPLIEQCSVATCPSLSHFKKAMTRADAAAASADAGPALLVGNPSPMPVIAGGAGFLQLAPLPASLQEVEQLQTDLATPTALIGPDATKANLLKLVNGKASSPCILHLATHGHHTDPSPKSDAEHSWDVQGSLAFADAKTTANSFLLAREIAEWRLPATQLAVLSACSSHVGTFQEAEGGTPHDSAAGLSFAFLMAGVPRSLVSLWPVSDFATKELMLHFYRHLQLLNGGGGDRGGVLSVAPFTTARALRLATRDLWRDHPDYKQCHVMWAAFVVSGLP